MSAFMMPTLSSLVTSQVVVMTICSATSNDDIIKIPGLGWFGKQNQFNDTILSSIASLQTNNSKPHNKHDKHSLHRNILKNTLLNKAEH